MCLKIVTHRLGSKFLETQSALRVFGSQNTILVSTAAGVVREYGNHLGSQEFFKKSCITSTFMILILVVARKSVPDLRRRGDLIVSTQNRNRVGDDPLRYTLSGVISQ